MVTTKKVARSVRTKKAEASALKRSSSIKSGASKKIKTSSQPEKTARLKIKNNATKSTRAQTKTKSEQQIASKLARVEALHAKKSIQEKRQAPSLSKTKPVVALALLSPYRFPVQVDQLAHGAARFGGVFFVVLGAFFTMLFANGSFNYALQTASLTTSTFSTIDAIGNTVSGCSGSGSCENPDTRPSVSFDVDDRDRLTGTAPINIKVKNAQSVKLMAYYKTQGQNYTLGTLKATSDEVWELQWNTTQYDDGEYKLKALVQNQFGTYEVSDNNYVVVENHSLPEESSNPVANIVDTTTDLLDETLDAKDESSEDDDSGENTDDQTKEENTAVSVGLTSDKKESSDSFRFEITASDADKVKVYAKNVKSNERKLLGYAYESDGLWKFKWLLGGFAPGEYLVQALALTDGDEYASDTTTVKVIALSTETSTITKPVVDLIENTVSTDDKEVEITPDVAIKIHAPSPLRGIVPIQIAVTGASKIELFAVPHNSLIQRYIGAAKAVDDSIWKFEWDTKQIPNGDYKLVALVHNLYGSYSKEISAGKVQNEVVVVYTEQQQQKVETLTDIGTAEPKVTSIPLVPQVAEVPQTETLPAEQNSEVEPDVAAEENVVVTQEKTVDIRTLLADFQSEIDDELDRLAAALRVKDTHAVERTKERLETLKTRITRAHLQNEEEEKLIAEIDAYLKDVVVRVEENVKKVERVIAERTQEKANLDTDQDGISDYDEVTIYSTDPYTADSDNDGFQDGAEILNGYNPIDAVSEALIAYESPKEAGIVREDILKVDSVISAEKNEETDAVPAAIITGKALPNSFVTLYIFSTPIVVTLKTDADGSWAYRFDKELEDGEHEVYVGVTDNAGKIVAKSEPFTFVKEAEAFSANEPVPQVSQTTDERGAFASQYMVYLVISISVVAIGLVLILLGLHLDARPRKLAAELEESTAV